MLRKWLGGLIIGALAMGVLLAALASPLGFFVGMFLAGILSNGDGFFAFFAVIGSIFGVIFPTCILVGCAFAASELFDSGRSVLALLVALLPLSAGPFLIQFYFLR